MTEYSLPQNIAGNQRAINAWHNRIDVWSDPVAEYDSNYNPQYPTPAQWQSALDAVSGIAPDPSDNSVWIASSANGLRHLDHDGNFIGDFDQHSLTAKNISARRTVNHQAMFTSPVFLRSSGSRYQDLANRTA